MRRIRQDDTVQILTGKDRGQRGPVREVLGQRNRVLVQGVNMIKKHIKAQQIGQPSGIVESSLTCSSSSSSSASTTDSVSDCSVTAVSVRSFWIPVTMRPFVSHATITW